MAVVKCSRGHFYDNEKYTECPMCSGKNKGDDIPRSAWIPSVVNNNADDVKTMALGASLRNSGGEDSKTIGINLKNNKIDPVVGWLVCVEGDEKGRDYRLHAGRNFIGRDYSNDVVLAGDRTVSKKDAGYIIYEPHKNFFMIMNGESAVVYVNGALADKPTCITEADEITIGSSKFALVAFCKGDKKW